MNGFTDHATAVTKLLALRIGMPPVVYHRGYLAADCGDHVDRGKGKKLSAYELGARSARRAAMEGYLSGRLTLVQRRLGDHDYDYIAHGIGR